MVGWYKRGEIVDVSKEKNNQEERVDASKISFHIITLKPSHPKQLNMSVWKEKKYQVKNLQVIEGED